MWSSCGQEEAGLYNWKHSSHSEIREIIYNELYSYHFQIRDHTDRRADVLQVDDEDEDEDEALQHSARYLTAAPTRPSLLTINGSLNYWRYCHAKITLEPCSGSLPIYLDLTDFSQTLSESGLTVTAHDRGPGGGGPVEEEGAQCWHYQHMTHISCQHVSIVRQGAQHQHEGAPHPPGHTARIKGPDQVHCLQVIRLQFSRVGGENNFANVGWSWCELLSLILIIPVKGCPHW